MSEAILEQGERKGDIFILAKGARSKMNIPLQNCPKSGVTISAMPGSRDSVCRNCGYKDPCCE